MWMATLLSLAWKFRKPLAYLLVVVAILAAIGAAVLWHKNAVKRFGAERYAAGESAERIQWQNELAKLKAEQEIRRQSDEQKLRNITTALADEKSVRRDQQDSFEKQMIELEAEDAKSGVPLNTFDPRVLRVVR